MPLGIEAAEKIPTTVTVSVSPTLHVFGELTEVTATVSPAPDTGAIYFDLEGFELMGLPVDPPHSTVTWSRTLPSPDTYRMDVWYSGSSLYAASAKVHIEFVIPQFDTSLEVDAPALVGRMDPFMVEVMIDPLPDGGRIEIAAVPSETCDPCRVVGQAAIDDETEMSIQVAGLQPGTHNLRASYTGTDVFATTYTDFDVDVFDRPTNTTIEIDPGPWLWGEDVPVEVAIDPIPDDEHRVQVIIDGHRSILVPIDPATGKGSTVLQLQPGSHTALAQLVTSDRWGTSSDSAGFVVSSTPVDQDPPVGTLVINGGAEIAYEGSVVVTTAVTDASQIIDVDVSCDGTTWAEDGGQINGDWLWAFGNGGGCDHAEGLKTIHARWGDAYGNVGSASDTIHLDWTGPVGVVLVDGGASTTLDTSVSVDVPATDAGSGVTQVALSNDAVTWTSRAYIASVSWTLSPGNGVKTVWARWLDGNGHWSSPASDTIVLGTLDTVAPTAGAPAWRFVTGTSISSGRTTVRLGWTGSDATSGIARYELAQSTDGGGWTTVSTALTSSSLDRALAHGRTYRFRVRAVDVAGNVGAWMAGPTFRLTHYGETSSRIRYSGTWAISRSAVYWGSQAKASSSAGARATISVTGRSVEWVARKGPGRGKAQVYVNGVLKATVDLYASAYQNQRVVWAANWSTSATRTISIRVLGTSGRPRVDLDAIVVGS